MYPSVMVTVNTKVRGCLFRDERSAGYSTFIFNFLQTFIGDRKK